MALVTLQDTLLQVEEGVSRARSCYHLLKDTLCLWSSSYVGQFPEHLAKIRVEPRPEISLLSLFPFSISHSLLSVPSPVSLPRYLYSYPFGKMPHLQRTVVQGH